MCIIKGWIVALVLATGCLACGPAHADQVPDQAKKFLELQQPQQAFGLLGPLEARRAGEIEFDNLLDISTLDAGDTRAAVSAFERALGIRVNERERGYLEAADRARRGIHPARLDVPER